MNDHETPFFRPIASHGSPWQLSGLASMMLIALYDLLVSLASGITEPPKSGLVEMVPLPLRHSTLLPQMSQKCRVIPTGIVGPWFPRILRRAFTCLRHPKNIEKHGTWHLQRPLKTWPKDRQAASTTCKSTHTVRRFPVGQVCTLGIA